MPVYDCRRGGNRRADTGGSEERGRDGIAATVMNSFNAHAVSES